MSKLLRLDDVRFYGLLLDVEKNFSKTPIIELKKEFERRKMLKPTMVGGVCVHSTSILLKRRMESLFPKPVKKDKKFTHSTEDIAKFFEIFEDLRPKRRYVKRLEKDPKQSAYERLLLKARMNEMLEELLRTEKEVSETDGIIDKIISTRRLTPFGTFLNGNETKPFLNLLLSKICEKIYVKELKLVSKDENIINIYNSRVRGLN